MKIRCLLAFVGLAMGFALPTFAQQTTIPDPQLREALATLNKKFDDGFVNSDAAALAALYTDDAVHVTFNRPPIYGREAIQKHFEDDFKTKTTFQQVFEQARGVFSSRYRYGWECVMEHWGI